MPGGKDTARAAGGGTGGGAGPVSGGKLDTPEPDPDPDPTTFVALAGVRCPRHSLGGTGGGTDETCGTDDTDTPCGTGGAGTPGDTPPPIAFKLALELDRLARRGYGAAGGDGSGAGPGTLVYTVRRLP